MWMGKDGKGRGHGQRGVHGKWGEKERWERKEKGGKDGTTGYRKREGGRGKDKKGRIIVKKNNNK